MYTGTLYEYDVHRCTMYIVPCTRYIVALLLDYSGNYMYIVHRYEYDVRCTMYTRAFQYGNRVLLGDSRREKADRKST